MAQCNWDPKKHGGRPCPVHGGGGLWDENVFTRNEKLKKAGYTKKDLEDEDLKEDFDGDYEVEFDEDYERSWGPREEKYDFSDDEIMEELSDNEYVYKGLDEESIYNLMSERLSKKYDSEITPEEVKASLTKQGFKADEYNAEEDEKPYDFDKWAKETNSDKKNHVGYIDTNKKYDADNIFDIIVSDDGWQVQGTTGDKFLLSHKSGPTYTFDKSTGKVELTTKGLEEKKGKEAHTKELTDYVKSQIAKGIKDAEQIYQNSPYSIHSHDEIVKLVNKYK